MPDWGLVIVAGILLLGLLTPIYVAYDTRQRNSDHWLAWTVISVWATLTMWIFWVIFYFWVRDDAVGERPASA